MWSCLNYKISEQIRGNDVPSYVSELKNVIKNAILFNWNLTSSRWLNFKYYQKENSN